MGDISEHFSRHELACKCGCGFDGFNPDLLPVLEDVRQHFSASVVIDCACRCPAHNKAVGGGSHSQHLLGNAADIKVTGVSPDVVATFLEHAHPDGGIGRYNTFTHVDVRGTAARWDERK